MGPQPLPPCEAGLNFGGGSGVKGVNVAAYRWWEEVGRRQRF